jgi:hypothetical protein
VRLFAKDLQNGLTLRRDAVTTLTQALKNRIGRAGLFSFFAHSFPIELAAKGLIGDSIGKNNILGRS